MGKLWEKIKENLLVFLLFLLIMSLIFGCGSLCILMKDCDVIQPKLQIFETTVYELGGDGTIKSVSMIIINNDNKGYERAKILAEVVVEADVGKIIGTCKWGEFGEISPSEKEEMVVTLPPYKVNTLPGVGGGGKLKETVNLYYNSKKMDSEGLLYSYEDQVAEFETAKKMAGISWTLAGPLLVFFIVIQRRR